MARMNEGEFPMKQAMAFMMILAGSVLPATAQDALPDGAVARVGSIRLRHQAAIQQIVFLPDGNLASLDCQGLFHVWDAATGQERRGYPDRSRSPEQEAETQRRPRRLSHRQASFLGLRDVLLSAATLRAFSADGRYLADVERNSLLLREQKSGKILK